MKLSIVVPVYFNQDNLHPLYKNLKENVFDKLKDEYELIFVDDGSQDHSFTVMEELQAVDQNIRLIKLSRNFGSHSAILAGYMHATGDCATCISADLQDPPEIILNMLERWKTGAKVVLAVRQDRKEPFLQKFFSNLYYSMMKKFALKGMPKGGFDCCLIDRQVIDIISMMEEKNTTIMGQIIWCGFKPDFIYYVRRQREIGESMWTFSKKLKLSIDSFLGFSYIPIRLIIMIGLVFTLIAIVWSAYIIIMKIIGGITIAGYATLIIINLFSFGMIMLMLGILGEYLWRVFDSVRKRPPYIIERIVEKKDEDGGGDQ